MQVRALPPELAGGERAPPPARRGRASPIRVPSRPDPFPDPHPRVRTVCRRAPRTMARGHRGPPPRRDCTWARIRRQGDRGAVALVGPARSGKTTAAIAGILDWDGPAILSSVKADLLAATLGWRSGVGEVRVFDPTHTVPTTSRGGILSPRRQAGTAACAQRAARALCEAATRGGTVEGGIDFWLAQGEILLSGLLYVAQHTGRNMGTVADWVLLQDRPGDLGLGEVRTLLDILLARDDDATTGAAEASRGRLAIWDMDDRTCSSVYATVQTVAWHWSKAPSPPPPAAQRRPRLAASGHEHALPRRPHRRPTPPRPRLRRPAQGPHRPHLPPRRRHRQAARAAPAGRHRRSRQHPPAVAARVRIHPRRHRRPARHHLADPGPDRSHLRPRRRHHPHQPAHQGLLRRAQRPRLPALHRPAPRRHRARNPLLLVRRPARPRLHHARRHHRAARATPRPAPDAPRRRAPGPRHLAARPHPHPPLPPRASPRRASCPPAGPPTGQRENRSLNAH